MFVTVFATVAAEAGIRDASTLIVRGEVPAHRHLAALRAHFYKADCFTDA